MGRASSRDSEHSASCSNTIRKVSHTGQIKRVIADLDAALCPSIWTTMSHGQGYLLSACQCWWAAHVWHFASRTQTSERQAAPGEDANRMPHYLCKLICIISFSPVKNKHWHLFTRRHFRTATSSKRYAIFVRTGLSSSDAIRDKVLTWALQ